jgi:hypothetical protein
MGGFISAFLSVLSGKKALPMSLKLKEIIRLDGGRDDRIISKEM